LALTTDDARPEPNGRLSHRGLSDAYMVLCS